MKIKKRKGQAKKKTAQPHKKSKRRKPVKSSGWKGSVFNQKISDWNKVASKALRAAEEAEKKATSSKSTALKTMYKRAAKAHIRLAEKAQAKAIEIATAKK